MNRPVWLIALCLLPHLAIAQTTATDEGLSIPPAAQVVIDSFDRPLHPIINGVAPGGGVGVGLGYDTPKNRVWFHDASALVTVNRYWLVDAETGHQTPRSRVGIFWETRQMGHLDFFGIGQDSVRATHANFQLRESVLGVRGWFRPRSYVKLGGSLEAYFPRLGPGSSQVVPSIEELFLPSELPGLGLTSTFGRYRGLAEFTYPALADPNGPDAVNRRYQGTYQIALETVREQQGGRYNFQRLETELQQRFPGFRPDHRLTLHGLMALTNADAVVPFYLQYTLGGKGLSAFRPDTIGSDGTTATLRSYHNYRFRDRDLVLMQVEYRIPVRGPIHATVFYDAGQVAARAADLFTGVKPGEGFSLSYMRKGHALVRLDVGYGSGEGAHLFLGFKP